MTAERKARIRHHVAILDRLDAGRTTDVVLADIKDLLDALEAAEQKLEVAEESMCWADKALAAAGVPEQEGDSLSVRISTLWRRCEAAESDTRRLTERYRWRPISELHEDFGPCVLMDYIDPGYLEIGSNMDTDFNASDWTHFSQIVPLSHEDHEQMCADAAAEGAK